MKKIAIILARAFKRFPFFGRVRFWILYWAYKLTGWHIRHEEWDFVLKYLPKLHNPCQKISVMDVGCNKNLLCHEIIYRGYNLTGIDMDDCDIPYPSVFLRRDITNYRSSDYDFVICVSVLEHIGDDGKGDFAEQKKALANMCASLEIGGRLILTTPTREFAMGHPWHGFSWYDINSILPKTMRLIESTEKAGQLCMALERQI